MALAGNLQKITFRFDKLAGEVGSVDPSTAWMAVTHPGGTVEAIDADVSYDGADTVIVIGVWEIPDDATTGVYWVTADVSGNLEGAGQTSIDVTARHAVAAP